MKNTHHVGLSFQSQNVMNLLGDTSPVTSPTSVTKNDTKPSNILSLLIDLDLSAPAAGSASTSFLSSNQIVRVE